jgi:uncharacterized membrane protein
MGLSTSIVVAVAAVVIAAVIGLGFAYCRWSDSVARRRIDRIVRRYEREEWRRSRAA